MHPTPRVLHEPDDITREWLEYALGHPVREFTRSDDVSNWGAHVRLRVRVREDEAPLSLRVKIGSAVVFGRSEVDYYLRKVAGLADAPVVRCHHAAADATHYHLLLDDLADTHRNQFDVPPTEAYGRALVDAAVRLHAHHWPQPPPDAQALDRALAEGLAGLAPLLEAMGEGFTAEERDRVRVLVDWLPKALAARLAAPAGFTWVHGDLNPGNILAPIEGDGPVYLIDHQPFVGSELECWLGASDLAYAIALWWPVEARRAWERPLVEHWHARLVACGVTGYPLERAWEDWWLCAHQCVFVPAGWCAEPGAVTAMRWVWEPQLRRILAFAGDHG